ncbi:MAG: V4R domain-containing protein [Candidatus Hodarchaeales archaeon]
MILGVYVFLTSGLPIFFTNLSKEKSDINEILFAGISSAINMFVKEIAQSDLESIEIEDGKLLYKVDKDLIFVVHTRGKKGELIGEYLINFLGTEFKSKYGHIIQENPNSVVDNSLFWPFEDEIEKAYEKLVKLSKDQPELFKILPTDIPISLIDELEKEGKNLIKGFPNDTIRLIRRLDEKYKGKKVRDQIMLSLGKFFGREIAKKEIPERVGSLTEKETLKLLNEISITKFDRKKSSFSLAICPICRKKSSDKPMCHFFSGFISGCFNNPRLLITESSCKAAGGKNCIFKIKYVEGI